MVSAKLQGHAVRRSAGRRAAAHAAGCVAGNAVAAIAATAAPALALTETAAGSCAARTAGSRVSCVDWMQILQQRQRTRTPCQTPGRLPALQDYKCVCSRQQSTGQVLLSS